MSALPETGAHPLSRREVVTGALSLPLLAGESAAAQSSERFALPGPFRGRVVEVKHAGSVENQKVQAAPVRSMMERGMQQLTGAPNPAAAWKRFFQPGDVVGIKVSPVGRPHSVSQPETVAEVLRGLNLAGVPDHDIIVFNRYEDEMEGWGLDRALKPGIQTLCASKKYDDVQTDTEGYDTAVYREFPRVMTGVDASVAVNRRSHLCNAVSKRISKVVNIAALKDHASAGITMALKNISHGMFNNVCRTHAASDINWCDTFIPEMVSLPIVRRRVVLHIGDGLIGSYDGGPGTWNPHWRTWEYRALFFATDPVAMDRIGWQILDARRKEARLPPLATTGKKGQDPGHESFDHRQPEHVLIAGKMGLGESDLARIDHRIIKLA